MTVERPNDTVCCPNAKCLLSNVLELSCVGDRYIIMIGISGNWALFYGQLRCSMSVVQWLTTYFNSE